jgi:hypothetical protein
MKLNVLLFPSGSQVANEIYNSLKYEKNVTCIGADYGNENWSAYVLDKYENNVPIYNKDNELEFISKIKNIINKYNITCIIPCFDKFISILKRLENELSCKVIAPHLNICNMCEYKSKTYSFLKDEITVPEIYNDYKLLNYPLFIKPDNGYGSRNSHKIEDKLELNYFAEKYDNFNNYLLCEYLSGDEFTVDCLSNKNELLICNPRKRKRTIQGISVHTETIIDNNIYLKCKEIGNKIFKKIGIIGCWFFQVKYNSKNELCLLEIAPRIAGAMCLTRNLGVNLPLLSIYIHLDIDINNSLYKLEPLSVYKTFKNIFLPKKIYNTLYIDLDDTIIIKDKVNTDIISLIYQFKNNKKNIILLTRNLNPIDKLNKYCIDSKLFNDIYIVKKDENKSKYIDNNLNLFIDDSYMERKDVFNNCKYTDSIGIDQIEKVLE